MDPQLNRLSEQTQTKEKDVDSVDAPKLSPEAILERSFDLNRLFMIAQLRESPHPQFDGMGYMKYNETNEMADISYIAPKKNKYDTRVTSGITHEKDSSIVSLIQSFNFESSLTVYYKEQELPELSTSLTAWIRKCRELINYDEKRPIHYRNLIVQGTAFADVRHKQTFIPNKVITSSTGDMDDLDSIEWQTIGVKKHFDGVDVSLVDGKKVFLEDIHQPDIRKQPGIYTVEYVPRELIAAIWGQSPRWKNVPKMSGPFSTIGALVTQGSIYSEWFYMPVDLLKMEVITATRPMENRFQIYLNGVPMLKEGFPLTAVSPSGNPTLTKGDIDTMSMFAYSKGIPSKTKMDQALYDALVRIGVIMFEQQAFPPTGNNSGRLLSPDIFMPSKLTRNLHKEDLSILTDNPGLQPASFQFIDMIKTQIDNKSVTSLLENGNNPEAGNMTLGQYMDQQKRQLVKLGGIFDGVINWEKQIDYLILMDCLAYGAGDRKTVAVKDTFLEGGKGTRVLRFKKGNLSSPEDLHQEEIDTQQATGQDVRYSDMDPDRLKAMIDETSTSTSRSSPSTRTTTRSPRRSSSRRSCRPPRSSACSPWRCRSSSRGTPRSWGSSSTTCSCRPRTCRRSSRHRAFPELRALPRARDSLRSRQRQLRRPRTCSNSS